MRAKVLLCSLLDEETWTQFYLGPKSYSWLEREPGQLPRL